MQEITNHYYRDVLRRYRLAAGMTQEQLAGFADISTSFLSMMEIGRKRPNVDMLIRLAWALEVRPGEMLDALVEEYEKGRRKNQLKH